MAMETHTLTAPSRIAELVKGPPGSTIEITLGLSLSSPSLSLPHRPSTLNFVFPHLSPVTTIHILIIEELLF